MNILNQILSKADSLSGIAKLAFENPEITSAAAKLLSTQEPNVGGAGGMAGLMEAFQSNGMGDVLSSWIGKGENLPIDASALSNILGDSTLSQFADTAGIDKSEASNMLANVLPSLIDNLTPDGAVPDSKSLDSGLMSLLT